MKTISLHGDLKKFSSEPVMLDAPTPQMITRGLISQLEDGLEFRKALAAGRFEFLCINNKTGKKTYIHDEMTAAMNVDHDEIHITPVVEGSGKFGQIILGVILIVVGAVMNFYAPGSGAGVMAAGIAMVAGGVVQLLMPAPDINSLQNERPDSKPSYIFNGAVNVYEQGGPVPLVYGRTRAGSVIVSAGFDVERLAYNVRCGRRYEDCGGPRRNR